MNCLQCFGIEKIVTNHKKGCLKINGKKSVNIPKNGSNVQINNSRKQLQAPFVIYADFESNLKNIKNLIRYC